MALYQCGLPDSGLKSRKYHFDSILEVQQQTYIYHEIGEIKDVIFDHHRFRAMTADFPHTPVELLTRTVKDILADCGPDGVLNHFINTENSAGLAFYAAFQDGLFLPLFPEYRPALRTFNSDMNWDAIDEVREKGFDTAKKYAQDLMALYRERAAGENKQQMMETMYQQLIQPLIQS